MAIWQAHQQQVGGRCQVFARHRTARHQRIGGAWRFDQDAAGWPQHRLRAFPILKGAESLTVALNAKLLLYEAVVKERLWQR